MSVVADRFGFCGKPGTPPVAWDDWSYFLPYSARLNWFLPASLAPIVGAIDTLAETAPALLLLFGAWPRYTALASGVLLLLFALTMNLCLRNQSAVGLLRLCRGDRGLLPECNGRASAALVAAQKYSRMVIQLTKEHRIALMCAEAVPWRCHRSLIGDALTVRGIRTQDIMSLKLRRLRTLTPFAHVHGSSVTYPAENSSRPKKRTSTRKKERTRRPQ